MKVKLLKTFNSFTTAVFLGNQWTGFYMIETPVTEELFSHKTSTTDVWQCPKYTSRSSHLEMFCKKMFLKISQNPLDNTCVRVSIFLNKVASFCTGLWHRCFLVNFYKVFMNILL